MTFSSTTLKLISLSGFMIMAAGVVVLLWERALIGTNVLSIAVQVLSAGLMIWARVVFGRRSFHAAGNPREGGLVTSGPYRWSRHPIYAAVLYFVLAGVLTHLAPLTVILGVCVIAGICMRVFVEERLLRRQYRTYSEYADRSKRLVPFLW
jgi:protein-S-isoprenylcysteine O-methyltransferase Ste14